MSVTKAFAVMCCVFSLFIQVAAHAATVPQSLAGGMNCAEMAQAMPRHEMIEQDGPSDRPGCCPDMALDCLFSMNCLPIMAIAGSNAQQPATLRFALIYLPVTAETLESQLPSPESPPPQPRLTA